MFNGLGDSHVFRFNNPIEVRKQRDRVKSNLNNVTNAGDSELPTRPTSPGGSHAGNDDIDWRYAQREAALARLHGLDPGLDSLPDEDLNKLFDRITKLRNDRDRETRDMSVRGRPESSMSGVEDMWSHYGTPLQADAYTADTSDTSITGGADGDSEFHAQLDAQKLDYEARLSALQETEDPDDLKAEREHMEAQLKLVQSRMKRLLNVRARGAAVESAEFSPEFEPTIYTARQLRLVRAVLEKWRAHRSFSMSEHILTNAVLVKEANVIRCVVLLRDDEGDAD